MPWKDIYLFRRNARDKHPPYKALLYHPNAIRRLFFLLLFSLLSFFSLSSSEPELKIDSAVLFSEKVRVKNTAGLDKRLFFFNYAKSNRKLDIILLMLDAKRIKRAYLRRRRIYRQPCEPYILINRVKALNRRYRY